MSLAEVEEDEGVRMEADVEAVVDALEDLLLVYIVVTCVDYADCVGPGLLGRTDCCPQNAFAAASSVAINNLADIAIVCRL